jgi:hypothetical protein
VAIARSRRAHGRRAEHPTQALTRGILDEFFDWVLTGDWPSVAEDLSPNSYEWAEIPTPPIAIPGVTKFA